MRTRAAGAAKRPAFRATPCGPGQWAALALLLAGSLVGGLLAPGPAGAANPAAPPSLKRAIPVPQPGTLDLFLKSRAAAITLGKALFWDMQVGSDAVQSCATCHFHAGADSRTKNVVSPGLLGVDPVTLAPAPDTTFQSVGPNGTLDATKFPFTQFLDPNDRTSPMIRSWNDVVSSPGVYNTTYAGQPQKGAVEQGLSVPDPDGFRANGLNTRRVEPRNAPTVINAVFNFTNFHDGRANSLFNGSTPFGDADPAAGVWVEDPAGTIVCAVRAGTWCKMRVRIPFSSLASQAVGPPTSHFEMSFAGRTFPDIGKKLLNASLVPLGKQSVHPKDSVLGPLAKSTYDRRGRLSLVPGLKTTYAAMIKAAFHDQYWSSTQPVKPLPAPRTNDQFTQMEANFAFFFGLAVQMYEATLVSDDSPFDRFQDCLAPDFTDPYNTRDTRASCDPTALSPSAQEGLNIFLGFNEPGGIGGSCIACHSTATFTNASVMHIVATNFGASLPEGLIERMLVGDLGGAWYDAGYYNIGVRPYTHDLVRGGTDAFGNPLSFIERSMLVFNGEAGRLSYDPFATDPPGVVLLPCGPNDPFLRVCPADQRVTTKGSAKAPTLRNVDLTGPYMHNGGEATLMQVMDFYVRGGNFFETNLDYVDADISPLFGLNPNPILNPGGLSNPGAGDLISCAAGPSVTVATVAECNQRKVVDFLRALTDERVRQEKAPFDHPELFVPNGATLKACGIAGQACDVLVRIPPVGAGGLAAEGLPPIGTFLNLNPYQP